jgi:hypothetical protein
MSCMLSSRAVGLYCIIWKALSLLICGRVRGSEVTRDQMDDVDRPGLEGELPRRSGCLLPTTTIRDGFQVISIVHLQLHPGCKNLQDDDYAAMDCQGSSYQAINPAPRLHFFLFVAISHLWVLTVHIEDLREYTRLNSYVNQGPLHYQDFRYHTGLGICMSSIKSNRHYWRSLERNYASW